MPSRIVIVRAGAIAGIPGNALLNHLLLERGDWLFTVEGLRLRAGAHGSGQCQQRPSKPLAARNGDSRRFRQPFWQGSYLIPRSTPVRALTVPITFLSQQAFLCGT